MPFIEWEGSPMPATSTARSKKKNPTHLGQVKSSNFLMGRQKEVTCTKRATLEIKALPYWKVPSIASARKERLEWFGEQNLKSRFLLEDISKANLKLKIWASVDVDMWSIWTLPKSSAEGGNLSVNFSTGKRWRSIVFLALFLTPSIHVGTFELLRIRS